MPGTPKAILRVAVYSFPKGQRSAYQAFREVSVDGIVTGGHVSGSPDAPFVHHETKTIGEDEVHRIWQHAKALALVEDADESIDRNKPHMAIVIDYSDQTQLRLEWDFNLDPPSSEARDLNTTMSQLRVGAW